MTIRAIARLFKMNGINAAGEAVNLSVFITLRFVEAGTAGKDQIGAGHQRRFALLQLARRILEGRKLIHTVVNHQCRIKRRQQRQCHWRIEPDERLIVLLQQRRQQQQQRGDLAVVKAGRVAVGMWLDHRDVGGRRALVQTWWPRLPDRLLDKQHAIVLRQACQ